MILTEVIISLFHLKNDYLLSDNRSLYHISRIFWEHIDEDDLKLQDFVIAK